MFFVIAETGIDITPPTEVKVFPPSPKECQSRTDNIKRKTLVCVASGFYPDHVSVFWQIDGEKVTKGVATDIAAQRPEGEKFYHITSRLRVPAKVWNSNSEFTCTVVFFNKTHYEHFSTPIFGDGGKFIQNSEITKI